MTDGERVFSFDRQKFLLDKYYDIIKMRAAQVLALFIAYGFALRDSKVFLDTGSVLAMVIPLAAWTLDMVARRHYGAPLAYAAICEDLLGRKLIEKNERWGSIALLILDFKGDSYNYLREIFEDSVAESERRSKFYRWYTFRDQVVPFAVFSFFFLVAVFATSGG